MPDETTMTPAPAKVTAAGQLMCGWPLVLMLIGGAIGGALGGAATLINLSILKSKLPVPAKICLNLLVGLTACCLWLAAAVAVSGIQQ